MLFKALRPGLKFRESISASQRIGSWIPVYFLELTLIMAFLIPLESSTAHGATDDAMTLVKDTVKNVLGVVQDHRTPEEMRRQRLIELVAGDIDFADMARSTMGYHWRQLTAEQRQRFVPLFTVFMEDAFIAKIESYSGQTIEFLGETHDGSDFSQVNTQITQRDTSEPTRIDYRLRKDNGQWKVYDVTVDEISIMANYRNQFNRVINNHGIDVLMNEMQSKQQQLTASLTR
jgi:phospholipid transport system substrate-binding protein